MLIVRATSTSSTPRPIQLTAKRVVRLHLPQKVTMHGLLARPLVFTRRGGLERPRRDLQGRLGPCLPAGVAGRPADRPTAAAHLIFAPGPSAVGRTGRRHRESGDVAAIYDNVRGRLWSFDIVDRRDGPPPQAAAARRAELLRGRRRRERGGRHALLFGRGLPRARPTCGGPTPPPAPAPTSRICRRGSTPRATRSTSTKRRPRTGPGSPISSSIRRR